MGIMEIAYIVGAFVVGVIFHATASALWAKWFPVIESDIESKINPAPVAPPATPVAPPAAPTSPTPPAAS